MGCEESGLAYIDWFWRKTEVKVKETDFRDKISDS